MAQQQGAQLTAGAGPARVRDGNNGFSLLDTDVRMTLSHRVAPYRGLRPVLVRHWFSGTLAARPGHLAVTSGGLLILNLQLQGGDRADYRCEQPTPACLELVFDGERCSDQLHGIWQLRLFTHRATSLRELICPPCYPSDDTLGLQRIVPPS